MKPEERPGSQTDGAADNPPGRSPNIWRRLVPALILAALLGLALWNGWHKWLTLEHITELRDRFQATISDNLVLAVLAFIAAYALIVSLSVPGASICTLAGGLMFGWIIGGLAAVVAATVGAVVVFLIARSAFGESLAAKAGPQIAKLQAGFKEDALSYLLFLRLVPAFPFFVVNIVPALLDVPLRTYVIGTFLGILPGTMAYASIGAGLDSVIAAAKLQQQACLALAAHGDCHLSIHLSNLVTTELKIAFGLLSVLSLVPVAIKKWKHRHAA